MTGKQQCLSIFFKNVADLMPVYLLKKANSGTDFFVSVLRNF